MMTILTTKQISAHVDGGPINQFFGGLIPPFFSSTVSRAVYIYEELPCGVATIFFAYKGISPKIQMKIWHRTIFALIFHRKVQ
jgi:hypothetical protein